MGCSVLQQNLEPPTIDQLKRAFSNVPGLAQADATTLGGRTFGILARSFERECAEALQAALAAEGVETAVVEDGALPALPEARMVHRIECTPEALMLCDPLGRSFPLKWEYVLLIAAGLVPVSDFTSVKVPQWVPGTRGDMMMKLEPELHESVNGHWLIEVVISGGALRYTLLVDRDNCLLFQYLGNRRTANPALNVKLVVQDLVSAAPQAAVNRGACYLRDDSAKPFYYPGKKLFYEEMIWFLWKMK